MSLLLFGNGIGLPSPLSRDAILNVKTSFQGLTVVTKQYGQIFAWGPEISSLDYADRIVYYNAKRAAGDTHIEFAISWNYQESSFSYPVPGRDLTNNLDILRALVIEAITIGGFKGVLIKLAGDGESNPSGGYNDPAGWTYGRQWLMDNFQRIFDALRDLNEYIIWVPGYDGVWYGWNTPDDLEAWFMFARSVIGAKGYLAIEFSVGIIFWRSGSSDYASTSGQCLDLVLQEFDTNIHQDSFWQPSGRLLNPYIRPSDQPNGDDPNPPYYLTNTSRGPQCATMYEFDTYAWVRGQISLSGVNNNRSYGASVGWKSIC